MRRGRTDAHEQAAFRPGHPHLPSPRLEPLEQGGAAARVEVGGDFVEKQDRAAAGAVGDEIGVGEDDRQKQRLLFAGRALRRGLVLVEMGDGKIGPMRSGEGAAGGGVAGAATGQLAAEILAAAVEGEAGAGERTFGRLRQAFAESMATAEARAAARAAPCSAMRASRADSQASSRIPGSASSLLRARIAAS